MTEPIRIVVADDHPVVRDGLTAMLNTQPDLEVVGEAGTGRDAVEQVTALEPDVVLLDLEMPELDGVEALQQMRHSNPRVRVIVFTAFDTDERILGAVQAGAQGYLLKGVPREELFNAIRVVHQGGSLLQPVVASKLLRQVSHQGQSRPETETLTRRELEVLKWCAAGKSNWAIGEILGISEHGVDFHMRNILRKLDADTRVTAVVKALHGGLIVL